MNVFDVVVIGGGASGLVSAIEVAKKGLSVCIIERLSKIGKKILATGNGRCNMTNLALKESDYRSEKEEFPYEVLKQFSALDALHYFEELGIIWKEESGYVYPRSEQATAIVSALELKIQSLNIEVLCDRQVIKIEPVKNGFCIKLKEGERIYGGQCILATGGKAQSKLGSDGSGYELAKQLGHRIIPIIPALTGLHTEHPATKQWAGVRAKGRLTCLVNGKQVASEQGEIQFTNYGISGVPTFQISRYATHALKRKKVVEMVIDFYSECAKQEFQQQLFWLLENCYYKNIRELLEGIFSKKLVPVFLKEAGIKDTLHCDRIVKTDVERMVDVIKAFPIVITDSNDFEQSQVCAGGVSVEEVEKTTLESKLVKGVYLTGELLDVDGTCGGYNLQWAWTTGYLAGNAVQMGKDLSKIRAYAEKGNKPSKTQKMNPVPEVRKKAKQRKNDKK